MKTPRHLIQHIDRRMLGGAVSARGYVSSPEVCHLVSWWKSRSIAAPTREKDVSGGPRLTLSRPVWMMDLTHALKLDGGAVSG